MHHKSWNILFHINTDGLLLVFMHAPLNNHKINKKIYSLPLENLKNDYIGN